MKKQLARLLAKASLVYQAQHSREEIAALALIFAEALDGEDAACIERAFSLHFQTSKRFPTPAHIRELFPEVRPIAVRLAEQPGTITPGFGQAVAQDAVKRLRGRGKRETSRQAVQRVMADLLKGAKDAGV